MEIKVNLHLTVSTELIDLLSELISNTRQTETETPLTAIPEKTKRTKPAKAETVTVTIPAGANGVLNTEPEAKVDLSTIRQFVASSEESKTAAKALLPSFGVTRLTDLPVENYAEYFNKLKGDL